MNFQELFTKAISEVSRLTGKVFSPEASEAEILAEIEQIPSLAEQNATLEANLQTVSQELSTVKEQLGQIQPGITEAQMAEAIEKAITANTKSLTDKFAGEIKSLRDLAEASKVPAGQSLDATIEASTDKPKPEPVQKSVRAFGRERAIR